MKTLDNDARKSKQSWKLETTQVELANAEAMKKLDMDAHVLQLKQMHEATFKPLESLHCLSSLLDIVGG